METIPPDHTGVDPDRETDQLRVQGESYDDAMARLRSGLREGWRIVWVRTVA